MAKNRTLRIEIDFHYVKGYSTRDAAEAHGVAWSNILTAIEDAENDKTCIVIDEVRSQRLDVAEDIRNSTEPGLR